MPRPLKPPALRPGDAVRVVSLSSPVEEERLTRGLEELKRLGYVTKLDRQHVLAREGFFAGSTKDRLTALEQALAEPATRAVIAARGGYGSNYIVDRFSVAPSPKIFLGYSDVTTIQVFLWQKFRWITFYGPMAASGFDRGAALPGGYDADSLRRALTEERAGWVLPLAGEAVSPGEAEGILLGGCLTLVEATLATPWELDTRGSILVLEDRAMKPWQVDRALMHLKQAGKFAAVRGLVFGDFPDCEPPPASEAVGAVVARFTQDLNIPVLRGAAIGHTDRPMLTLPLGVRARLVARGTGRLEILEPGCSAQPD